MRKVTLAAEEFYHVYNRGTDKRIIFLDDQDLMRFLQSMVEFNALEPIGSLYQNSFRKSLLRGRTSKLVNEVKKDDERLVKIISYCLNPNHFHLILRQISERGIERFMQRLGTGYTMYFNHKYERTGVLFQGKFKAIHIDSNEYLLHVSAYVNLNFRVHQLNDQSFRYRSSWGEYVAGARSEKRICDRESVLGQFRNANEYIEFAQNSLKGTLENRGLLNKGDLLE